MRKCFLIGASFSSSVHAVNRTRTPVEKSSFMMQPPNLPIPLMRGLTPDLGLALAVAAFSFFAGLAPMMIARAASEATPITDHLSTLFTRPLFCDLISS